MAKRETRVGCAAPSAAPTLTSSSKQVDQEQRAHQQRAVQYRRALRHRQPEGAGVVLGERRAGAHRVHRRRQRGAVPPDLADGLVPRAHLERDVAAGAVAEDAGAVDGEELVALGVEYDEERSDAAGAATAAEALPHHAELRLAARLRQAADAQLLQLARAARPHEPQHGRVDTTTTSGLPPPSTPLRQQADFSAALPSFSPVALRIA